MIDRRQLLLRSAALGAATAAFPRIAFARAPTERRFVFVLLRGGADGLATLAPVGDPAFEGLRGDWAQEATQGARADGFFAIHPRLENVSALYRSGEALFLHAAATSYRERSHFDAQNLIESGGPRPYALRDGWLNRLVGQLGEANGASPPRALALASTLPLALQGSAPASSYAPSAIPEADADFLARLGALYSADARLAPLWDEALSTRAMAQDQGLKNLRDAEASGKLAASLLAGEDGARIMMVEQNGWDSHAGQPRQIGNALGRLDRFLAAFRRELGAHWRDTLVVVASEFGRTARRNGTNGTDHGTAGAAILLGGTLRGKRVVADWPGLGERALYEGRDLAPTLSLEAAIAGALAAHFALDPRRAMDRLFPERKAAPLEGLVRA